MKKFTQFLIFLSISASWLEADIVPIGSIQGAGHQSPFEGKTVTTQGIVTRVYTSGFIIESKTPDTHPYTSEALYVYQKDTEVSEGNELQVTGKVEEYIPGGKDSYNLSLTQVRAEKLSKVRAKATLPKPIVLNYLVSGFPETVKQPGTDFNPSINALDFWECIEHMRVVIMDASVSGPKSKYGEMALRVPQGRAEPATPKGGVKLTGYTSNAAHILVALTVDNPHAYNTGDRIRETIEGNLTYSYGHYKVGISKAISAPIPTKLKSDASATPVPKDAFKVASFNVENLYTELPDEKFQKLAEIIVESLHAPDIIGLQEIHDNSGPDNDKTVDANRVLEKLIRFITQAGGPSYNFLQINPENNADGGWPGANIRNAYLYTDSIALGKSYLLQNPAFDKIKAHGFGGTRKPLVAFFKHGEEKLIFINCHLKSKGGDTSAFGSLRPAVRFSETQRTAQTRAIRKHVDQLQHDHPDAGIVVLGDMNDYEFSPTIQNLTQNQGLINLVNTVPLNQRYTYIFQGYSQVLDHILVSKALAPQFSTRIAHVNSDFSEGLRSSDHDPILSWAK